MPEAGEITRLLEAWRSGEEAALERLMPLIYGELRRQAASYLRRERRDHTLESAALANEAYLRLVGQRHVEWQNRAHFFAIAAQMMRRILSNHARDRLSGKRGRGQEHLPLREDVPVTDRLVEWIEIDDALERLAATHPQQARIVELRYFGGLTSAEIAEVLGLSVPTVSRRFRVARAWIYRTLSGKGEGDALRSG